MSRRQMHGAGIIANVAGTHTYGSSRLAKIKNLRKVSSIPLPYQVCYDLRFFMFFWTTYDEKTVFIILIE